MEVYISKIVTNITWNIVIYTIAFVKIYLLEEKIKSKKRIKCMCSQVASYTTVLHFLSVVDRDRRPFIHFNTLYGQP